MIAITTLISVLILQSSTYPAERIKFNYSLLGFIDFDLENWGLFGYSIRGTTSLSLAVAELNYSQLQQDYNETLNLTNISILDRCRALEIEERNLSLQEERIAAAFLFVPFGKSLFGETELNKVTIPIL
ncbi:hypothetical protein [Hyella patelloides]|uniref:hypothetical protein n=1 Tax=Hyella patelloides TaxID=1982969 RepID=UPI0011AA375C|nr:hypothetical protein [Hyella patelloides]